MEQRLTIVTLGVSNVKEATEFYEAKVGWKRQATSNENITFFQLNGILLSLFSTEELAKDAEVEFQPQTGSDFRRFTMAYNCRSKDEVDQVLGELETRGVNIVKKAKEVFWGGYSGYFSDPDNNLWEVAFNPFLTLDKDDNAIEAERKKTLRVVKLSRRYQLCLVPFPTIYLLSRFQYRRRLFILLAIFYFRN